MITQHGRKKSIKRSDYAYGNSISEYNPLISFFHQIVKLNSREYAVTALLQGGGTNNRKNIVFTLNAINGNIYNVFEIPLNSLTSVYDSHRKASIEKGPDDYIFLIEEKGKNSTGHSDGHNTELYVWKSSNPGNTQSFTKVATINENHTYPNFQKIENKLFLTARGTGSNIRNVFYDVTNTDDVIRNIFISLSTGFRAYPRYLMSDDDWLYHVVNERTDANINWPNIYFLKSKNGTKWYNADEFWSKSTTIQESEAKENLLAVTVENQTTGNVLFISGHSSNGIPKMLIMAGPNTGVTLGGFPKMRVESLRWYFYRNGWNYTDISSFFPENFELYPAPERYFVSTKTVDNEYIYVIDPDDNNSIYEYKSKDNFQTYKKRKVLEGNGNYLMGNVSGRNVSQKEILLCVYDTNGTWWNGTNYNWDGYSNLIFIRP
jgi:hypothetical protein